MPSNAIKLGVFGEGSFFFALFLLADKINRVANKRNNTAKFKMGSRIRENDVGGEKCPHTNTHAGYKLVILVTISLKKYLFTFAY